MASISIGKPDSSYIAMPYIVINRNGKVLESNWLADMIFGTENIEGEDIFSLTGLKTADLFSAAAVDSHPLYEKEGKEYRLLISDVPENGESTRIVIAFEDVSVLEDLKERYNKEKICVCKIQIDNEDQLLESGGQTLNMSLSTQIDEIIRKWAEKINGSVSRIKTSNYTILFEQEHFEKVTQDKFSILDSVRNLESRADFPASLSIGIGAGGKNIRQTEDFADEALDLALGRGGDQAVVKRNNKVEYYGGTLQTVEKSNKGKSRIVGHALRQLIKQSTKVFIMGHRYTDMDSFGAGLGIYRLCELQEKEVYLVVEDYNESLDILYKHIDESGKYNLIGQKKAARISDKDSLAIVVDTQKPSMVQCPKLLEICEKIVVIDHHRKTEDTIEKPTLQYTESYASSTSELVTEILQFVAPKKTIEKVEAEALLAGMMVDTNNFAIKTGVRTFDAAAWLRRQGADPTEIKRFFQENADSMGLKANAITRAKEIKAGIYFTMIEGERGDAQLMCAQIADQLLTIRGAKASFVCGRNKVQKTVVSARSLGDINVQVIMEKLGGGGHLTTAAAQMDMSVEEAIEEIKKIMEEL